MPGPGLKVALATDNWSSPAVWDAGVLPIAGDTVCANGFTVTIDQTVNVAQLTTAASTNTGQTVTMTSNTTPAGYVAAASSATGGGEAFRAFVKDGNSSVWATINNNTGWISYQFPSAIVIDRYSIMGAPSLARSPNTWTFEGSNDGVTWTPLHSVSGSTIPAATWYNSPLLGNVTAYTRYRVNVTAVGTLNNPVSISEIYLYEVGYTTVSGAAGGGFTCSTSQTITCTASTGILAGTTTCLTFNGASPASTTVNANVQSGNNPAAAIVHNSSGTLTVNGNINSSTENNSVNYGCLFTGTGTFNVVGNLLVPSSGAWAMRTTGLGSTLNIIGNLYSSTSSNSNGALNINGNSTINITGNLIYRMDNNIAWSPYVVQATSQCTVNLTGNIFTGLVTQTVLGVGFSSTAAITFYMTGDMNADRFESGATATYGTRCVDLTTNASYFNHIGTIRARNRESNSPNLAFHSNNLSSITILTGPFIFGQYGSIPMYAARMFINTGGTGYIQFRDSSTNGALPPGAIAPTVTWYPASTIADAPVPANVRSGVVYALGSQTGTLVVPPAGSVANGVVYDNGTVGIAVLTPGDVWNALTSTMSTPGSIGERLKNASTVATTGSQLAAFTS